MFFYRNSHFSHFNILSLCLCGLHHLTEESLCVVFIHELSRLPWFNSYDYKGHKKVHHLFHYQPYWISMLLKDQYLLSHWIPVSHSKHCSHVLNHRCFLPQQERPAVSHSYCTRVSVLFICPTS